MNELYQSEPMKTPQEKLVVNKFIHKCQSEPMKTPQEKWVENIKIKNAVFLAFRAQKMTFVQMPSCSPACGLHFLFERPGWGTSGFGATAKNDDFQNVGVLLHMMITMITYDDYDDWLHM